MTVSFSAYVSGNQVADELLDNEAALVECLVAISKRLARDPQKIVDIHDEALESKECADLRALGTILGNLQGD